ncbi:Membrane-associated phosphatidylinositol transfer protein 3 [Cricetulus griseus]|uniref:Membrane-associated phosphatidylinositol transfer protein 3 n=1 Tax=Cricetulus griseus TaxID=10029 RepID=G3HSB1_CRIGR|nr:Membrane-associated phosphatidylinositol transfer protein 3 [Cricetulus griseus]
MQKQRVVSWLSQHNFPQGMIFFSDGLVHDPLRQKAIFLRNLMQECFIKITAASSSTKDISVYSVLGLPASQIFIVGRPTKKYQTQCQVLTSSGADLSQNRDMTGVRDPGNWGRDEVEHIWVGLLRNCGCQKDDHGVMVSSCLDCKAANCLTSIPASFTKAQRRGTEVTESRRLCRTPSASGSFTNSCSSMEQTLATPPKPRIR